jgi:hypothetical protein
MITTNNLPATESSDSSTDVKLFFDKFFLHEVSFPAAEIDTVTGFFLKRGFDDTASKSVTIVLLNQARQDSVNVFQLIDTLKGLTDVQLSQVVAEVLNAYREKTSILGYKTAELVDLFESRNIVV